MIALLLVLLAGCFTPRDCTPINAGCNLGVCLYQLDWPDTAEPEGCCCAMRGMQLDHVIPGSPLVSVVCVPEGCR